MNRSTTESECLGPDIPKPLGTQLKLVLGLDSRPQTFSDWVDALAYIAERNDIEVGIDMLCTTEESPHKARFDGGTEYYQCVLDPIIVPFLAEGVDTVEIETQSPVSEKTIELTVTETGVEASPTDAVFSFGVDANVEGPPEHGVNPIFAYGIFCPYGNAFASYEEYEEWADGVDAITMATDMDTAIEWARAIGRVAH
ncbi:organomercurial lyase [Halomarina halobia]|uniref:Organomercurial lyase n=1 Tax=Halomarina halobia TaxID=3033386 RepID=A0ABD6A7Z0_9EURY|nr:organomercurial lyase [Halomarina sp. PSR21]